MTGEDVDDRREAGDDGLDEQVGGQADGGGAAGSGDVRENRAPQHEAAEEQKDVDGAADNARRGLGGDRRGEQGAHGDDGEHDHGHHRPGEELEGADRPAPAG